MHTVSCEINGKKLSIETGKIARQAHGSVLVRFGETIVLVTAVSEYKANPGKDFLPLTVEYREKSYATGRIPGGFFKREARPSTKETLVSRLIDRPLRPLFPKGYACETQVLATVLSADKENDADVLSIVGASAALEISDIPFNGPIAGVRVGRVDGKFIVNPTAAEIVESDLDMVVAGSKDAVIMVEGGARIVPESEILEAIYFGHEALRPIIAMQEELRRLCGKQKRETKPAEPATALKDKIWATARDSFNKALHQTSKLARHSEMDRVREETIAALDAEFPEMQPKMYALFEEMEKELLRDGIINTQRRVDGRGLADIRNIECEVTALPQVHGSALFTRGETQALAVVTLGTRQDEQKIEALEGDYWKSFLLHYNFPPFSVGEVRTRMGVSRRELGHGNLAERAIEKVIPAHDDFPYTVRCVSEVLESNGSSSMATVCSTSLAIMDAGIPSTAPVAGIAMGLVKAGDKFFVLSDILGDEDHCGDMDFKVAGTKDGVTAFQMDIKISGITREIMDTALKQAYQGRLHILSKMNAVLDKPRAEMSPTAPRIEKLTIPVEKIKDLIGPGGKMIKKIIEETGASIDVEDDGTVMVSSINGLANKKAIEWINNITAEAEVGKFYKGKVVKIMEFGAFVEIIPGTDGLIHISQLDHHRVNQVTDVLHEGDIVIVKCIGVDPNGKISLSRKEALGKDEFGNAIEGYIAPPAPPRSAEGSGERHERGGDGGRGGRRNDRGGGGGGGRRGGGDRDRY